MECARPPVLILGMHRSGTTMVARLLDRLGLFLGRRLQRDHEATYFLRMNDLVLRRINASWDHPVAVRDLLACDPAVEMTVRCLEGDLRSFRVAEYLGWRGYLRYRSVERLDRPWGWKDPRTVFTLPLWLRLFPGARLAYIVRNGVDVASSLTVRARKLLERRQRSFRRHFDRRLSTQSKLERAGFKGSVRCLSLAGSFSLWEEHVACAERALAAAANERLVVRYEDFVADPGRHLAELAAFCGLRGVSGAAVAEAVRHVSRERSGAFTSDPVLLGFYGKVRATRWMAHHGYAEVSGARGTLPFTARAG